MIKCHKVSFVFTELNKPINLVRQIFGDVNGETCPFKLIQNMNKINTASVRTKEYCYEI